MKKPSNSPNCHYDSKIGWYYVRDIGDRKMKCKWPEHGFRSNFEGGKPKFKWYINGKRVQSKNVYQLIGENRSTQWWRCNPGKIREMKVRGKTFSIRAMPV